MRTADLKHLVADPSLDREALKAIIRKNGSSLPVCERHSVRLGRFSSERTTACKLLGVDRASYRYEPRRMLGWAEERRINLIHIQPGRPTQNGYLEGLHGCLRDECLNANWFRTLNDVRRALDNTCQEYNCERPHSSLA